MLAQVAQLQAQVALAQKVAPTEKVNTDALDAPSSVSNTPVLAAEPKEDKAVHDALMETVVSPEAEMKQSSENTGSVPKSPVPTVLSQEEKAVQDTRVEKMVNFGSQQQNNTHITESTTTGIVRILRHQNRQSRYHHIRLHPSQPAP